jgi:hypothetical protein
MSARAGSRITAQVTQKTPNATRCAARGEERALLSGVLIERPHGQANPGPIVVRGSLNGCAKFHSLNEFSHGGTRPGAARRSEVPELTSSQAVQIVLLNFTPPLR